MVATASAAGSAGMGARRTRASGRRRRRKTAASGDGPLDKIPAQSVFPTFGRFLLLAQLLGMIRRHDLHHR